MDEVPEKILKRRERHRLWHKNHGLSPEALERRRIRDRIRDAKPERKFRYKLPKEKERRREYEKKVGKTQRKERRLTILKAYCADGKIACACCAETCHEFLVLDHVEGSGEKHRKLIKRRGDSFYRWIIKQNFPAGFRVLCNNCNMALGVYKYCPHKA